MKMKRIISLICTATISLGMVSAVSASTASGTTVAWEVNGRYYSGQATIDNDFGEGGRVVANVYVRVNSGSCASGEIGVSSYIYDMDDNLCKYTSIQYIQGDGNSGYGVYSPPYSGSANNAYYAWGKVSAYNYSTSKYSSKYASSPSLNGKRISLANSIELAIAEYNYALETDSMIKAVTTNGEKGWIYAGQLENHAETIDDVAKINAMNSVVRYINVYDKDGKTVIGQFELSPAETDVIE